MATMVPRKFHDIAGCPNHYWSASVLDCGKKLVSVITLIGPGLHPHSPTALLLGRAGEYYLLPLICRQALVISTPLQHLNFDSGNQRFPDSCSSIISGFIDSEQLWSKLDYSDADSTQQSLWRQYSPIFFTMRFNARRYLSVSFVNLTWISPDVGGV